MIFKYLVHYLITDFLIDQKAELRRLKALYRKAQTEDRKAEIKEQMTYIYNQGLQAMKRYSYEIPSCVKNYFLGTGSKPSINLVSKELQSIHGMRRKANRQVTYGIVVFLVVALTFIAIFF